MLTAGENILIVHRRLFDNDLPRFFLGTVDAYEAGIVKVSGYSWIKEPLSGKIFKNPDFKTKLCSLSSGTLLVYELPSNLPASELSLTHDDRGRMFVTDQKEFQLNITERVRDSVTERIRQKS